MFAIWLVLSYDLLGEDRRIDNVTIHTVLLLYYVKQIDAMFVNRIREMVSFEPVESLRLSGRASEHGIRMSEVRFPHGDSEFVLCPTLVTRQKTSSSWFHVTVYLFRNRQQKAQNVLRTSVTHSAAPCGPLFRSHHIMTPSVIYYWTDTTT